MDSNEPVNEPKNNRLNISLSWPVLVLILIGIIAAMLLIWKPWSAEPAGSDRTVTVSGEATVKAEPDEFVFSPSYEFKNSDKQKALNALTKKSDQIVVKLKELGVADNKIKTNSSGYDYNFYFDSSSNTNNYSLILTVMVDNREKAQEIQDYLLTTGPTGSVSPQPSFSDEKRKELEAQARDEATKDARSKADQSAQNLGFKIGKVKSLEDGSGFGGVMPYYGVASDLATAAEDKQQSLAVQPGENDLSYSVKVVYYLK